MAATLLPADKAKAMINEYYQPLTLNLKDVGRHNNANQLWAHAKYCALVSVKEILSAVARWDGDNKNPVHQYYTDVQTEMEKA